MYFGKQNHRILTISQTKDYIETILMFDKELALSVLSEKEKERLQEMDEFYSYITEDKKEELTITRLSSDKDKVLSMITDIHDYIKEYKMCKEGYDRLSYEVFITKISLIKNPIFRQKLEYKYNQSMLRNCDGYYLKGKIEIHKNLQSALLETYKTLKEFRCQK